MCPSWVRTQVARTKDFQLLKNRDRIECQSSGSNPHLLDKTAAGCIGICIYMHIGMHVGMRTGMHAGMRAGTRIWMCIGNRIDMCVDPSRRPLRSCHGTRADCSGAPPPLSPASTDQPTLQPASAAYIRPMSTRQISDARAIKR